MVLKLFFNHFLIIFFKKKKGLKGFQKGSDLLKCFLENFESFQAIFQQKKHFESLNPNPKGIRTHESRG